MSKKSEAVKLWRKSTKQRIVDAMGGKCCVCGYNKCHDALALHHIDPSKKEMGIGSIRASPVSWDKIIAEVKKCILVCHNCHSEIHNGMIDVSNISPPLIEQKYIDYKEFKREQKFDTCPVCSGKKPIQNITCSPKCSAISRRKIDWDSIDIVEELKHMNKTQLAEKLGCSDVAIYKRLKKINSFPSSSVGTSV